MALLEGMGKMTVQLGQKGRKSLIAIAVAALFVLNLNVALADDGGSAWHGSATATTLSSSSAFISGYVWYDDDGDGILDQVEGGLEGVTIYLYHDNDGVLVDTQTSSQDGSYQFSNLPAGDYIVQVAETVTLGLAEYALTTDNPLPISLEEGENCSNANFGYEGMASPAGPDPTAVTLSSFMASSTGRRASPWPGLAVLATLAAGGTLWIRRQSMS